MLWGVVGISMEFEEDSMHFLRSLMQNFRIAGNFVENFSFHEIFGKEKNFCVSMELMNNFCNLTHLLFWFSFLIDLPAQKSISIRANIELN